MQETPYYTVNIHAQAKCLSVCMRVRRFTLLSAALVRLLSDIYMQLMNMDGEQDGTDVCPLRGDERRMCFSP